jgi:hypothetical protein
MCTFQEDGNERLAHRQLGRPLSPISEDPETHQITTKCFTDWRSGTDSKVSSFCRASENNVQVFRFQDGGGADNDRQMVGVSVRCVQMPAMI